MTDVRAALGQQRLAGELARHRHVWDVYIPDEAGVLVRRCRCGAIRDEVRARRGKSARNNGNRRELELARELGGEKVGMYGGPVDVQTPLINAQSKVRRGAAFPGWMVTEIAKLPRSGGRIPALIVTDSPGSGIKRRTIVVLTLDDFTDLHGRVTTEEAQP